MLIASIAMQAVKATELELKQITGNDSVLEQNARGEAQTTADGFEYEVLSDETGVKIIGYTGTQTEVTIPAIIENLPVVEIGEFTFGLCETLTKITIPASVMRIEYNPFCDCNNLTTIIVEEANANYSSVDGVLYNKDKTIIYSYPPNKNGEIYEIQNTVTTIGEDAFLDCDNLTTIVIPESVTNIIKNPFGWCTELSEITVKEANANYSSADGILYNKDKTIIYKYPPNKNGEIYEIQNTVTTIGEDAFLDCDNLTTIVIPESVETIGEAAFGCCENLTEITIPEGITEIASMTFWGCENLAIVNIPLSVTKIQSDAFSDCTSLSSITIPKGVTFIDGDAFFSIEEIQITIICADNSVAKQFAIENNIKYVVDNTYPTIEGLQNEKEYEEGSTIIPIAKDDNLKVVYLYKDGNKVAGYKNGDKILNPGEYKIVAIDTVGNETIINFSIKGKQSTTEVVKGDVTGDGKITATDILKMKKHIVQLELLDEEKISAGDINEDGKITGTDLLKAKRKFVGLE